MMTTFARKLLVLSALALPVTVAASLLTASPETEAASGDTHFGTYKLRIHATNAEMWKAKWICTDDDFNSLYTIDADTYPASTKTTRETNITADKCHTGKWKVEFYIKFAGNWKRIKPGAGICTTYPSLCGFYPTGNDFVWGTPKDYARPHHFDQGNIGNKMCTIGWNSAFEKIYLVKDAC
ncbi:MAG TPA: hypothetical protein VK034_09605 [Enhygromyxa sp.]|nr:hypothetical protein [Enhygromyxa sp.]